MTVLVQAQSFEYLYSTVQDEWINDVVEDSSGNYYLVGIKGVYAGNYEFPGYSSLIIKLDSLGDTIKTIVIPPVNSIAQLRKAVKLTDTTFAAIGWKKPSGSANEKLWFLKFDENLNIIGDKMIGDTSYKHYPAQIHKTSQNEIIVAGTATGISNFQIYFCRLNLDGDSLQSLYIGDSVNQFGFEILQLPDTSGYLLFGWGYVQSGPGENEIIKIDNAGNVDTIYEMPSCPPPGNLTTEWLSDSTFAVATYGTCLFDMDLKFQLFDLSFNVLMDTLIGITDTNDVIAERGIDFINQNTVFGGATINYHDSFWEQDEAYFHLIKFNNSMVPQWEKIISHNDDYLFLKCVRATNDGGILLAGISYNDQTANGLEHDIYVIKLDSLGNFTTGINHPTVTTAVHDVIVYPNPAQDIIHISSTINFSAIDFTLFDASGREVMHKKFNKTTSFSVKELRAGIYFYEIKGEKGKTERGKVVKGN